MTQVVVHETIAAPVSAVFAALTDPEQSQAFEPDVIGVEYLSEVREAPGVRFRQTRRDHKGREQAYELEVREYQRPERARMVTTVYGTEWDSLYTFEDQGGQTRVTLTMDARSDKLGARVMNSLLRGMFRRGIAKHLAAAKVHLESGKG